MRQANNLTLELLTCAETISEKRAFTLRDSIGIEFSRGIAAFMVMLSHYAYMITDGRTILNFLWTGVDLFFVISGFVFSRLILSANVNLGYFFLRRFFRIYPLYLIAVLIYFFLADPHPNKIKYLLSHLLFLQTTNSKEEAFFFNPAFWSLPVEVEFYLLIPILVYFIRSQNALIILFVSSIAFKFFIISHNTSSEIDIYSILDVHLTGILPEFLVGVFLYKSVIFSQSMRSSNRIKLMLLLAIAGFVSLSFLSTFFVYYGDEGLMTFRFLGGFFGLLCALSYSFCLFPLAFLDHKFKSRFVYRPMVILGSISYPVYLLHNAAPSFIEMIGLGLQNHHLFIFCIIFTVVCSFFLNKYIEEPFRQYGKQLSHRYYK